MKFKTMHMTNVDDKEAEKEKSAPTQKQEESKKGSFWVNKKSKGKFKKDDKMCKRC